MRKIKFRFWKHGEMCYDFDGWIEDVSTNAHFQYYKDNEIIVMQFTGILDKNGKEIYEGDIVNVPGYGNVVILWNENICAFQYAYNAIGKGTAIGGRMTYTIYAHETETKFKIIGNVYENPELLNK